MQGNITTEMKRMLITSFLFPKHRPRLNWLPRWLERFMKRPYSRWGTWRVEQVAWKAEESLQNVRGRLDGWSSYIDWGLSLEAGVDSPLTSSSQCLCFKTPNFLPLPWFFFMTYPVAPVIIGDSVPFSLLRTVYFHRMSESRMSLQDVTQNVIWLQSLPATLVCLMMIVNCSSAFHLNETHGSV